MGFSRSTFRKVFTISLACFVLLFLHSSYSPSTAKFSYPPRSYKLWGDFRSMEMSGFINTGMPGSVSCDQLKNTTEVEVQDGIHLYDDLVQIAKTLESHPMVIYPKELGEKGLLFNEIVEQTWSRMSGSSIWLPEQKVFLCVTRVIFYTGGRKDMPTISFLRGQLYDQDWVHLQDYNITWGGQTLTFPIIFSDIQSEYDKGGIWYGTEDPRIIIEDGVEGAEPVVIFNMVSSRSEGTRAMWIFRPFSGFSSVLTIRNRERAETEKNWAPFFVSAPYTSLRTPRQPSQHLHFIYGFESLRVLRCDLYSGECDYVYEQKIREDTKSPHEDGYGSLRGGTNFVPVLMPSFEGHPKVRTWVGFPRTHIETRCGAVYRPEYVVLVKTGSHFHLAYASDSFDFGTAVLSKEAMIDPCEEGRVLIPNSIALWDTRFEDDVMTVTFSVADTTVQVARIRRLLAFTKTLPRLQELLTYDTAGVGKQELLSTRYSAVGEDVRACSVEAGTNHTHVLLDISDELHPERKVQRLAEEKAKEEEQAALRAMEEGGSEELRAMRSKLQEMVQDISKLQIEELTKAQGGQALPPEEPALVPSGADGQSQDAEQLRAQLAAMEDQISSLNGA